MKNVVNVEYSLSWKFMLRLHILFQALFPRCDTISLKNKLLFCGINTRSFQMAPIQKKCTCLLVSKVCHSLTNYANIFRTCHAFDSDMTKKQINVIEDHARADCSES